MFGAFLLKAVKKKNRKYSDVLLLHESKWLQHSSYIVCTSETEEDVLFGSARSHPVLAVGVAAGFPPSVVLLACPSASASRAKPWVTRRSRRWVYVHFYWSRFRTGMFKKQKPVAIIINKADVHSLSPEANNHNQFPSSLVHRILISVNNQLGIYLTNAAWAEPKVVSIWVNLLFFL